MSPPPPLSALRCTGLTEPDRRQEKVRRPGAPTWSHCRCWDAVRVSFNGLLVRRRRNIGVANCFGFIVSHGPSPVALRFGVGCAVRMDLSVRQRTWRVRAVFRSRRMQQTQRTCVRYRT